MTHKVVDRSAFGTFFLPGPTEVRPEVLQAMVQPMISHRGAAFRALYARLQQGLRIVFGTERPVWIATCSATGLMEAGIRNAPAGRVLALVNGAFSERFAHVAESCGRAVDRYEVAWGEAHVVAEVEARVRARSYSVVTVVHSETSTGVLNDVQAISRAAQAAGAVCLIDSVTGVRGAPLHFDAWHLDYVFTGSQKAIALPPGLAFAVASERFLELGERVNRGTYFDLAEFAAAAARDEAPNTPALSLYYALGCQLDHILAEGMAGAWTRHAEMAALVAEWAATVRNVASGGVTVLALPGHRSPTVSTIVLPVGSNGPTCVRAMAERGYTIGEGYGQLKATTIRIGHMGDHTVMGLAACLRVFTEVLQRAT